ncbi:MAG: L-threonylcarbamoyladenylate synthase [Mycobacteriales bacterium]
MGPLRDCRPPMSSPADLDAAEAALRRGELVVLPTDTVYGLAADAFNPSAVRALLAAKRRSRDTPVPVLVGSWQTIEGLTPGVPAAATELIHAFWPGGLTLIVRQAPSLAWDLGETAGTVAVRMPLHPVALDLLRRTGPLAVSSANRSGVAPATTVEEARAQLGLAVSVYLDGGSCGDPVPSTIVDLTVTPPRLLRAGVVPLARLREVLPDLTD